LSGSTLILYNNFYFSLERFYNFSGIITTARTESGAARDRGKVC